MLDVGETLVDETRVWETWADILGVPRLTFMAAFGAVLDRGQDFRDVFQVVGAPHWRGLLDEVEARYGGFKEEDLYPDALPAVAALHALGYRVGIIANQPSSRSGELRALGFEPDAMAMSDDWGVRKPQREFFVRALAEMGGPDSRDVACVGDRVDNDILPSAAIGMRPVWLRRGPFGVVIHATPAEAVLVVDSLAELVERIDECWAVAPAAAS
jgi:HAD superfamily hydrolase (TIGR01549 family)